MQAGRLRSQPCTISCDNKITPRIRKHGNDPIAQVVSNLSILWLKGSAPLSVIS
jgi:hypothetical protein